MNDAPTAPVSTVSLETPLRYRCCAASHTYGISALPAGLTEDVPDVTTADPASFGISIFAEMYRTVRYRWASQTDVFVDSTREADDLAAFYATLAKQDCPASVLVRIEDAALAHSVLYAQASHDPAIIYETHRPNDRAAVQLVDRSAILGADRTRFADPDWANFFVGSAGSSNYGHWLVDDLPRLKAVSVIMRHTGRPVRVIIHHHGTAIDDIRMESIRLLLGADVRIDLVDPAIPHHFDELFYVTPVTYHPVQKSPEAMEAAVRDTVGRIATDTTADNGPTLIFVDRSPRYGRALSNHDDIRRIATDNGFTVVDPDGMRFVDQVRLFASAQVVIGQMGAAMTNTLFCRPTTTVIHLAPTGWSEPFYFDLATVRGHRYRVLFGAVADPLVPAHRSDFTIDPGLLTQAIRAL